MTPNEVTEVFQSTGALLKGHFELRSKLHSDHYFQCALVLRYPRIAGRLCAALVATMRLTLGSNLNVTGVIAPAMGGLFVGHEIGRELDVMSLFVEKENDKLTLRRGFAINKGDRYIVAEDVITRGGRVQETIDIVTQAGGEVVAVAVIVDRSGGKAHFACPIFRLLALEPVTWEPARCPLCAQGLPIEHPGSTDKKIRT